MAVGLSITRGLYNGKMTWFVLLSCMMAAMGGVIFSYDIRISGLFFSAISILNRIFPANFALLLVSRYYKLNLFRYTMCHI
jgi:hypothetical protein|uniref:Uncharacterized protein n=1 Tax=Populus trichocarpa TaxID=3694 RepID=U5GNP6_POPTR